MSWQRTVYDMFKGRWLSDFGTDNNKLEIVGLYLVYVYDTLMYVQKISKFELSRRS